jgi:hypothetical protein
MKTSLRPELPALFQSDLHLLLLEYVTPALHYEATSEFQRRVVIINLLNLLPALL